MAEVNIKTNLKLFPWQLQVLHELKDSWKGYIHVIKSKRQVGKSVLLQILLLQTAITRSGTTSILLSPTLDQARKIFNACKTVIHPTKLYYRHSDTLLFLKLTNGSEILFKSAEQREALKGYTVTGIYCVDEAAYVPDDIFYDTMAWVNVSQAPVVICSTPFHKTGFFYKYYTLGTQNGNKVFSYNWSAFDTSELLPPEKLEQYRREFPASKFKTDYLGEFLDNEGGVFGNYAGIINDKYEPDRNCYMGVDWGTGQEQDSTSVCVFNDKNQMIGIHSFNDMDETKTIECIIELIKRYKPLKIMVEWNSIGIVFYGLLDKAIKKAGLRVMLLKFITTNESKERIINNFQVLQQRNEVQILNNPTLLTQMDMFEMKLNKNNKRTYNAHNGYHDDCIMSMLIALECMNFGSYCVR